MIAPTAGYTSESIPVSTAKAGPGLCGTFTQDMEPPPVKLSSVKKSSERANTMSATHTAHTDHANQAAVRRLILPTSRPCFFVPFVTTITLQDYLLPSISTEEGPGSEGPGPSSASFASRSLPRAALRYQSPCSTRRTITKEFTYCECPIRSFRLRRPYSRGPHPRRGCRYRRSGGLPLVPTYRATWTALSPPRPTRS